MIINRESKDVVAVMMTMTTMILMIHIEDADIPDDATTRNSQKVLNYLTYLSHLISSSIQLSITMVAITVNVEMMDTIAAEVVVMDHHLLQMETSSLISIGIQVAYAQLGMT
jgi:hypothetical protein